MAVTTVDSPPRRSYKQRFDTELGPVANFGAQFFLAVSIIFSFQVSGFKFFPGITPVALLVGAAGVLLLAPRLVLIRLPVSLSVMALGILLMSSLAWSDGQAGSVFALKRDIPLLIGMMMIVGVISLRNLVAALLWTVRGVVLFTAATVALFYEARIHIDESGLAPDLEGWHGFFPHKNIMTPFLVFGILTTLTFDQSRYWRWTVFVASSVLLVGSTSVTGISAAFLAVSVWVWLQLYRHLDLRNSSVFVISSASMALFALIGVGVSLSTITSASGKDLTLTGRTFIWQATVRAIAERPLLGWGYGGVFFDDPATARTVQIWRETGFRISHPHNGILDVAVQVGFVGLALFAVLFLTTLFDGLSIVRERPKVGAWIVSTMVAQLYISLLENVFFGAGWLLVLVMFRVVLLRKHGMELETGARLADHVRGYLRP